MKHYDTLLFDLDGTLTDSAPGITRSVRHALTALGIEAPEERELLCFVGPPLSDSFRDRYRLPPQQIGEAIASFRQRYEVTGIFENSVYPGIPQLLAGLKEHGYRLTLATSKPEHFARRILERFELAPYFSEVCGASSDETRVRKWEVIEELKARTGFSPESSLMIGDREHDVLGARRCGIDCAGVLWGYGSRGELEAAGARYLSETPEELLTLLRQMR